MDIDCNNCTPSNYGCKVFEPFTDEKAFIETLSGLDKIAFMPGIRQDKEIIDTHDYRYLKSGQFRANLHVHSKNSDGLNCVEKLLNHANAIANRNFERHGTKFMVSITDHDTLDGAKEVYRIISENPEKYKNLKVVLGLEISALGNTFKNQIKPVTLHTLCYCINPFDKKLNDFIYRKKTLKLKLMNETIEKLNKELAPILSDLGITFTIEDAAKIHDMVLKGEDEVCRPLKKYTSAKIMFAYYTKDFPNKDRLFYDTPVKRYKQSFRNKEFKEAYKSALSKYLEKQLSELPEYLDEAITCAGNICQQSHPSMTEMPDAFSSLEETLELLSSLDTGLICVAHPARIEVNHIKSGIKEFYDELFDKFTKLGGKKAMFYEGYYQSYEGKRYDALLPLIDEAAKAHNLIPTGGMDSHGLDVISRCPYT